MASDEVDAATNDIGSEWWNLETTARRVGAYVWFERSMFEMLGAAVPDIADDEIRALMATHSRQRGRLAQRWSEQLPAHVAADHEALTAPATIGVERFIPAFASLLSAEPLAAVAVLGRDVLPSELDDLEHHLRVASPVSDAPVISTLHEAIGVLRRQLDDLDGLLERRRRLGIAIEATGDLTALGSIAPTV